MKGGIFLSFVERGGLVTVVLWVIGLMVVFSVLGVSVMESSIKLLVLLNVVNILFVMMISVQILLHLSKNKED